MAQVTSQCRSIFFPSDREPFSSGAVLNHHCCATIKPLSGEDSQSNYFGVVVCDPLKQRTPIDAYWQQD
jgi:hypothetical protein